jgi:hypothetical protein
VGRGENNFSFTFHWPPSKKLSPSPSFSFSLKGRLGSLELSSSLDIIFNSIWRILVSASFLSMKRMISFGSGGKEGRRVE